MSQNLALYKDRTIVGRYHLVALKLSPRPGLPDFVRQKSTQTSCAPPCSYRHLSGAGLLLTGCGGLFLTGLCPQVPQITGGHRGRNSKNVSGPSACVGGALAPFLLQQYSPSPCCPGSAP